MMTKKKIIDSIKSLADKFCIDEFVEQFVLRKKIDIGMEQSETG